MELSKRLLMVASMVEPGSIVADVGCDHGYVSIYLVRQGICPRVLAMDVNAGPLERVKAHVQEAGLAAYIDIRRSDGLSAMKLADGKPEADTLLMAGLGGRLAARILKDGRQMLSQMRCMILQPQSELWLVREAVRQIGYFICDENMLKEDGKFYTVIRAENGIKRTGSPDVPEEFDGSREEWGLAADRYGPCLIGTGHPVLREYLEEALNKNRCILRDIRKEGTAEKSASRAQKLEEECALMEKILRMNEDGKERRRYGTGNCEW